MSGDVQDVSDKYRALQDKEYDAWQNYLVAQKKSNAAWKKWGTAQDAEGKAFNAWKVANAEATAYLAECSARYKQAAAAAREKQETHKHAQSIAQR